jgi:PIN domain
VVEPVETHFMWRPQLRDPADELVLEAAVNGQAGAIVTFNRRDFGTAPARFGAERREHADMKAFDRLMRRKGGEPPRSDDTIA